MSQLLTPVSGGLIPEVQTTTSQARLNVLSPQYISANRLESRPTEWVPGGRPIYGRLPGASETYRIDFFNLVTESNVTGNTSVKYDVDEVGYVFVPWGENINGPVSLEVVTTESDQTLLVKAGVVVWKYGRTEIRPTLIDLEVIDAGPVKYDLAYQLIYDDAPTPQIYAVTDFALTGQDLSITSSADSVIGWRFPALNAFLNSDSLRWSNEDSLYPSTAQPTEAFIQWGSELGASYGSITLRCPAGTAYSGTATLSYVYSNGLSEEVQTVDVSRDTTGQYFQFNVVSPTFQTGWKVSFSSLAVSLQSVTVTGSLNLLQPLASPAPKATLVMYPSGTLPETVTNSQGEEIKATYATLAEVDVGNNHNVTKLTDTRQIIRRDYVPVANWLTTPFDRDLIDLYEQVSGYSSLWMAPPSCLKQELIDLESYQITVVA
jgi:hypothetical protein